MPDKVSAQDPTGIIVIPKMPAQLQIPQPWIDRSNELISEAKGLIIQNEAGFYAASDMLKATTKHSNMLEGQRKDFCKPFNQAAKLIKQAADVARAPLEESKTTLNKKISAYAAEQRRIEREEREKAEAAARKEAERQAALSVVDVGLDDEPAEEEITVTTEEVARRAVSHNVRVIQKVVAKASDVDKIPRAFLVVDPRAVNAYIKENKERFKKQFEELPEDATIEPVPGLTLTLETSAVST